MILQLISAFIGTVAFSILFNVRKKYFLYCGITGTCGWLVYLLVYNFTSGKMIANFLAAIMVMFLSRTFAVSKQCPLTVFFIPGIFPLVPGAGIYYTAYEITQRQFDKVLSNGMDTFQTAVVIALAISIIITLPPVIFRFTGNLLKGL